MGSERKRVTNTQMKTEHTLWKEGQENRRKFGRGQTVLKATVGTEKTNKGEVDRGEDGGMYDG